jgi:hypothetical protein
MNIQCDKPKTIYKYTTKDGKEVYSIGLAKKKQDNTWETGFITCRFKKEVKLEHKTKILIKGGWLDFYLKDKNTIPFIFVNEFEIVEKPQENIQEKEQETVNEFSSMNIKTEYQEDEIKLTDEDLPF